jgi:hypothetical protein
MRPTGAHKQQQYKNESTFEHHTPKLWKQGGICRSISFRLVFVKKWVAKRVVNFGRRLQNHGGLFSGRDIDL